MERGRTFASRPKLADGWTLTQLTSTRHDQAHGLSWPLDLTWAVDGLYIADGMSLYGLDWGELRSVAMIFSPNYPGFIRGLHAVDTDTFIVSTSIGSVARYRPLANECDVLAQGLDQLYGVTAAASGIVVVAELGAGRVLALRGSGVEVLASGLQKPLGVAFTAEGACLISESGAGRVVKLRGPRVETVIDGLQNPQGVLVHHGTLYIVDAGAKALVAYDLKSQERQVIAEDLPLGCALDAVPESLRDLMPYARARGSFAGIAVSPTGTLYISAEATGSVLALQRAQRQRPAAVERPSASGSRSGLAAPR